MRENQFQAKLIRDIKRRFPGCVVLKNDPNYIQGFPDLLILYRDRWAALECKRSESAIHQANQDYYIDRLGRMSYAAFIFPENREAVLDALSELFGTARSKKGADQNG